MVEAMANGVEDKLIDGLSFKLRPGASYALDRRSVTYLQQGSNISSPGAGAKLMRFLLAGLDGSGAQRLQTSPRHRLWEVLGRRLHWFEY